MKRLRASFVVVLLLGGTRLLAQDPLLLEPLGARPSISRGRAGAPAERGKEGDEGLGGSKDEEPDAASRRLPPQPEGLSAKGLLAVSARSDDEPASPLTRLRAIEPSALNAAPGEYLGGLLDEVDLVCKLGGESDSADGSLGEARLYWRPSLDSLISGGYVYSTLTATNAPHTNTRIASLLGEYSFGSFGLGAGYDRIVESDLLASNTFTLRPFFESGAWRVEVNGSRRKTDFDRFGFVNVPLYRPAGTIYVSGSAKLNLTSTGFGGALDYMGKTWHAYASYDSYSYRDFEGETTVSAIRDANGRVSAQVFNALAGRLVERLQRFAGSRATQKAGLLDYAAMVGLDVEVSPFGFGLEAGRDKDHLSDNVSESLTGILSLDATRRVTLELRGGATRSDILGTIRFIGLNLVFRSIPKVKA